MFSIRIVKKKKYFPLYLHSLRVTLNAFCYSPVAQFIAKAIVHRCWACVYIYTTVHVCTMCMCVNFSFLTGFQKKSLTLMFINLRTILWLGKRTNPIIFQVKWLNTYHNIIKKQHIKQGFYLRLDNNDFWFSTVQLKWKKASWKQ